MPRKIKNQPSTISENVLHDAYKKEIEELRHACEEDIFSFAQTINPHRLFGDIHKRILRWLVDGKHNKLYLIPRDHQKSYCMAIFVAWKIACDPTATFLYLSATATLAEKQLYLIKNMLESKYFKMFWPDHLKDDAGKRDRWTTYEINIDHPIRSEMGIRDCTVTTGGVGKNITGLHPQYIIMDDVISPDNAYTQEGRDQVRSCYSQLASIESTDGYSLVTGTRYHPDDLYNDLIHMDVEIYNHYGDCLGKEKVYDSIIEVVEKDGQFLWPKEKADNGKEYGFDIQLLATKKAKYLDKAQFYAQYYNDPNRGFGSCISSNKFQYYNPIFLKQRMGKWYYKERRLNLYGAMDFATSVRKTSDFTAIALIGLDWEKNVFVLDLDQFKSDNPREYINHLLAMQARWGFNKMAAEVSANQKGYVELIKDEIRNNGVLISIDEIRPNRNQGSKEERMDAALRPRYEDMKIWHHQGGLCKELEKQLIVQYPTHDDLKDVVTMAINNAVAPARTANDRFSSSFNSMGDSDFYAGGTDDRRNLDSNNKLICHPKFGGMTGRFR